MTFREIVGSIPGFGILVGLALGALWSWEQGRKRRAIDLDIDTTDPLWLGALEKARSSLPRFFELAKDYPTQVFVKYPLLTTKGLTEHVWGPVVGAYTARAQFEYARKLGQRIPAHMLEIESRLVDA